MSYGFCTEEAETLATRQAFSCSYAEAITENAYGTL